MTDTSRPATRVEPLRIIYAGTPEFATSGLNALLDTEHQVIAVYTQPDRPSGRGRKIKPGPVKQLALDHKIPVFQPLNLRDEGAQQELAALKPDLMVVAAYGLILPQLVLDIPEFGCINIHASLLPRWRGAAPIQYSVLSGDTESGVTIMQMDKGLDTGDMLLKEACPIEADENASQLHDKLAVLSGPLLVSAIEQLMQGTAKPLQQDSSLSTYAPKIAKQDACINWHRSSTEISLQVRAFNDWPVAYTELNNERIRVWSAEPSGNTAQGVKPGTVTECQASGITVACAQGTLTLAKIQFAGGKALPVRDILNAKTVRLQQGDLFTSAL